VFVSIGPGSFTGLRVGVSVARTLAWAVGAKIVAVPTLDSLARNALSVTQPPPNVAVVLDAKGGRAFCAAYRLRDGRYEQVHPAQMAEPEVFLALCSRPLAVLGEGVPSHRQAIIDSGATILDPGLWAARAESVVRVGISLAEAGRYTPGGDLIPLYIRRPDPEEKWERTHGHA
jgi:tRNA threonylcarbamoyladenosine biosynthesis protein TsaB